MNIIAYNNNISQLAQLGTPFITSTDYKIRHIILQSKVFME